MYKYVYTHTLIHTIKGTSEIIVSFFQMQSKKPIPNDREWLTATESKGWASDSYYAGYFHFRLLLKQWRHNMPFNVGLVTFPTVEFSYSKEIEMKIEFHLDSEKNRKKSGCEEHSTHS